MEIKNVIVYGLKESIVRSGYPMQVGEPGEMSSVINFDKDWDKYKERALKLSKVNSGTGHDNFLKGIIVQFDLKYAQYFTPQLQRYNWIDIISSQSKMHKLTSVKDIGEHCNKWVFFENIQTINYLIDLYNTNDFKTTSRTIGEITINTKEDCFRCIISNLPMGYELWMGISTNYLQLKTIYNQRKNHKLEDWKEFCNWIETLPMLITNNK